jgi:small subunit ribosomal protein S17e
VARELLEKYPARFSGDFEANKVSVNELVFTKSKRLRNRIAGYVTRLTVIQADRAASMASAAGESEGEGSVGEEEE